MSKQYSGGLITKNPVAPTSSAAPGVWTLEQQMQAQKAETWPTAFPNYIEDVFSTYLYTGENVTKLIPNNIDLSTKGGLVWTKIRSSANDHILIDTVRGTSAGYLTTDANYAQTGSTYGVTAFNTNGYTVDSSAGAVNQAGYTYASWTFRKQPKFFDIQTYTGSASAVTINHNLGSSPGCVIIKCTDTARNWMVWHRSLTNSQYMYLNTTDAVGSLSNWISVSSTQITIQPNASGNPDANYVGRNYIAYIFAHDAGGFGLTSTDNVISCGSFATDGSGNASVTLGYEPQWLLVRKYNGLGNWILTDVMRGSSNTSSAKLLAQTSGAETVQSGGAAYAEFVPTATGFDVRNNAAGISAQCIYIAIRRGPMKAPTDGTKVFSSTARSGTGTTANITAGFTPDMYFVSARNTTEAKKFSDRLRGAGQTIASSSTAAESNELASSQMKFDVMNAVQIGGTNSGFNSTSWTYINYLFQRAPSFCDVVCYTGNGTARTISHNLGIAPELMIIKDRSTGPTNWLVYAAPLTSPATKLLFLDGTGAVNTVGSTVWNSTAPTSSVFSIGTDLGINASGDTYVAYLFATCPGVSKVGSYTGNGSSQTINCGFTAGARFVLIKRTDSTGDWYVWDTARGIVASTDPHLSLNNTAAEVTTDDTIDTDNSGFVVNQLAATNVNVTSATYIYLAIA